MSALPAARSPAVPGDRDFLGHPRGLAFLGFAEGWERFSYYGMQTLLVLYMTRQLLLPGHIEHIVGIGPLRAFLEATNGGSLSTLALSSAIFGLYTSLVYLTPIVGGIIADRWLGLTSSITVGALLMAAGHFLMAFEASFLLALALILLGVGLFKGNIASQVSGLYRPEDLRRADAFQIFYLFVNAAVIAAPLVTGTLGERYGWHWGFGAAGVGMLIGLFVYLAGRSSLPAPERPTDRRLLRKPPEAASAPLTRQEAVVTALLVLMVPVLACGAVLNQQLFNAYLLWAPDHIDLVFFGATMPTSWLITLDAIVSVSFLVGAVAFWRLWARHFTEPSEIWKLAIGIAVSSTGALCLVAASILSAGGTKASIGWVFGFEVLNSAGFANVFPVGLALFARSAPRKFAATIIGVYYLHLVGANWMVGRIGGLLEQLSGRDFWLLHFFMVAGAAGVMFLVARFAGHLLQGKPDSESTVT